MTRARMRSVIEFVLEVAREKGENQDEARNPRRPFCRTVTYPQPPYHFSLWLKDRRCASSDAAKIASLVGSARHRPGHPTGAQHVFGPGVVGSLQSRENTIPPPPLRRLLLFAQQLTQAVPGFRRYGGFRQALFQVRLGALPKLSQRFRRVVPRVEVVGVEVTYQCGHPFGIGLQLRQQPRLEKRQALFRRRGQGPERRPTPCPPRRLPTPATAVPGRPG